MSYCLQRGVGSHFSSTISVSGKQCVSSDGDDPLVSKCAPAIFGGEPRKLNAWSLHVCELKRDSQKQTGVWMLFCRESGVNRNVRNALAGSCCNIASSRDRNMWRLYMCQSLIDEKISRKGGIRATIMSSLLPRRRMTRKWVISSIARSDVYLLQR